MREYASDLMPAELAPGELATYVAADPRFAGAIIMRDRVREEASRALHDLEQLGVERMLMITGDVSATAEPIAQGLGIGEVHAECRPGDKVAIVRTVQ